MLEGTRSGSSAVLAIVGPGILAALLLIAPADAVASVEILSPSNGATFQAELEGCQEPPCFARINFAIEVVGANTERVDLHGVEGSDSFIWIACSPEIDPVEPDGNPCPADSTFTMDRNIDVAAGSYTVVATAVRSTGTEESAPVSFIVEDVANPSAGPVTLSAVVPSRGAPRMVLREPGTPLDPGICQCPVPDRWDCMGVGHEQDECLGDTCGNDNQCFASETSRNLWDPDLLYQRVLDDGILAQPSEVEIEGDNLDDPFLRAYLAPKPPGEPTLLPDAALPIGDWCLWEATILERERSRLRVRLPELPPRTMTTCGDTAGGEGDTFHSFRNWRWVIRRPRPAPELDELTAIPSPRMVPWHDAAPFKIVKPTYPQIDGFAFGNHGTDATFDEFLAVYGDNAFICLDCIPLVGCLCFVQVVDPIYMLWYYLYAWYIDSTGGSCVGMSSTSLLFAQEYLQTEDFQPGVQFPAGFVDPGPFPDSVRYIQEPRCVDGDDAGEACTLLTDCDSGVCASTGLVEIEGVPRYDYPNFCWPTCPPEPANLFAHIRMNHGVQLSLEVLEEVLETVGEAIFDPRADDEAFDGVPQATLDRVRSSPQDYVLSITSPGGGHAVAPFDVQGNRILIYDNNAPRDTDRFIDIVDRKFDYPARRDEKKEPNEGKLIFAIPIDIWKSERQLIGLQPLKGEYDMLFMFLAGAADMAVTDGEGGRWGWEDDGTLTEELPGALALPPLGPPDRIVRQAPLVLAMNRPAPSIAVNAYGGHYVFHAAQGGVVLQLEAADAEAGDEDRIETDYASENLSSFDFTPERDASYVVPRVGLALGEQERAVFHWLGLSVPGGETVGFRGDKTAANVTYRNGTGGPSHHLLAMDHASGLGRNSGRMLYGPFEVPGGGSHRVVLADWPVVDEVVSEMDFDGDGVADWTKRVPGHSVRSPLVAGGSADLSVEKAVEPELAALGDPLEYRVVVRNGGLDNAEDVVLIDALPEFASVQETDTSVGSCAGSDGTVTCELGDLAAGEEVEIRYIVTASLPGVLANGAAVLSVTGDPDLTNNTAVALVETPVLVDVEPGSRRNPVNVRGRGVVPVAILGQPGFDVAQLNPRTLVFGPGASRPAHRDVHYEDVNRDGEIDLLSHHRVPETGLTRESEQGCVRVLTFDGRTLRGCDAVSAM
jgi:uncharacterized repeat protein (TIGR01451 family)